jgi:hypothetical protein
MVIEELDKVSSRMNASEFDGKTRAKLLFEPHLSSSHNRTAGREDDCAAVATRVQVALYVPLQVSSSVIRHGRYEKELFAVGQFAETIHTRIVAAFYGSQAGVVVLSKQIDSTSLENIAIERLVNGCQNGFVQPVRHLRRLSG